MEEKIINRVRKLLAIANDNAAGGEHERDTAMKMALKLLAKHNLDMASVTGGTQAEADDRTTEREIYYDYVWMRTIAGAIAKLYFCSVFTTKSGKKDRSYFTFVGREANVATAKEMFEYVVKSVVAEASRVTTARRENQTFKWSFCKGAAAQIHLRCVELRKAAEAEANTERPGTALVLASLYDREAEANKLYIAEQLGLTLRTRQPQQRNTRSDGYYHGREYGDKVGLNKQVH